MVNNDGTTYIKNLNKDIIHKEQWNDEDRDWLKATRPPALDPAGALAALLSAVRIVSIDNAANAVGLKPDDLVTEVEAWAVAVSADFNAP